jgi:putative ABC transport system substrate-binding protein
MTRASRVAAGASLALLALGPAAPAQPPAKAVRIGVLRPGPDDAVFRQNFDPFRQVLHEQGFVEGTNLAIEYRVGPGSAAEIDGRAADLVRLKVDAIVGIAPPGVRAAARATKTIPIVAVDLESDPVSAGFAVSLARPGGNITGLFLDTPELSGKWIQLLKELVPGLSRIAVLWDPSTGPGAMNGAEAAAPRLQVQLVRLEARAPGDFATAFRSAAEGRAGAMLVLGSPVFNSANAQIAELAARHRLPTIMPFAGFAEGGGLVAYGPSVGGMFGQAAGRVLGVKVTPSMRLQADRVIE